VSRPNDEVIPIDTATISTETRISVSNPFGVAIHLPRPMTRAMRQLCLVILALVLLGVGGCLVTSHQAAPTHSQSAIVGCQDVAQVRSAENAHREPPQAVMLDLETLAPLDEM
jgi:hypothetical protein